MPICSCPLELNDQANAGKRIDEDDCALISVLFDFNWMEPEHRVGNLSVILLLS